MDTVSRVFESDGPLLIVWLLPTVVFAIVAVVAGGRSSPKRRRLATFARILALVYLAGVIALTLWPLDFAYSPRRVEEGNWTPFGGTLGFLMSGNPRQEYLGGRDFIANIALFFPLGFVLPFASNRWRGNVLVIMTVAALAFLGEVGQGLVIAERTFDIDDAIVGFVGGAVGSVVAAIVNPVVSRR